ncbi:MAG: transglutaminase domain-containing protein [Proteobacteria bacterium]|nr:transglutaminase domain-containing protein [Pseudomonadota bacterium]
MKRPDAGTLVEILLAATGVVLLALLFARTYDDIAVPVTITIDPAAEGLVETWSGIYVGSQKIGYSLSRAAPRGDGGQLRQERTQLRLVLLGQPNDLTLASDVSLSPDGRVERLFAQVKTEVAGSPVTLRVDGRPKGNGMELRVMQAGVALTTIDLDEVPATPGTIYPTVAARNPEVGERITVPYFSPLSLGKSEAIVTVLGHETAMLPDGTEVAAMRLKVEQSGQVLEAVIGPDGERIGEEEVEGGLGMRTQLQSQDAALNHGWPEDADAAVDLIALSSIPVDKKLPGGGRSLRHLVLEVTGPELVYELLERQHGDAFNRATGHLTIDIPDPAGATSYTLPSQDRATRTYLRSTTFIPADDPAFVRHAGRVLGDELDALGAADKLNIWVHTNMLKVPVAGIPSAKEILKSLRGDCNEHTTLYTALARSVGLPTRMAAGIVYSESIFADGAFYYHAWPEVWLGGLWVPIDPTFGQFPADATHVAMVHGPLDRQMEIMGVVGRLELKVVDAR